MTEIYVLSIVLVEGFATFLFLFLWLHYIEIKIHSLEYDMSTLRLIKGHLERKIKSYNEYIY